MTVLRQAQFVTCLTKANICVVFSLLPLKVFPMCLFL